jgi:DNA-binding GntR family transcriptional regulator
MTPPRQFSSKKDMAYHALRREIIDGELEMGSRLVIADLTGRLGVSPIPVREALQQLEADGFVEIEPHVGARVTEIDAERVSEIFALMESLEVIGGRRACIKMSDEDFAAMEDMLRRMDRLVRRPSLWAEENVHLHRMICEAAGTPLVLEMIARVQDHWRRLSRRYFSAVLSSRVSAAQKDHWRIYRALRTRDPDKIERVICRHNRSALAAYKKHLSGNVGATRRRERRR